MKRLELARLLLQKAAQDHTAMARLLPDTDLNDEIIGFHAQQAVEKALKAWLAYLSIDYPKVHHLETLLALLTAQGHSLPEALAGVTKLTPFATVFRYEELPLAVALDRADALQLVQGILAFVNQQVGERAAGRREDTKRA